MKHICCNFQKKTTNLFFYFANLIASENEELCTFYINFIFEMLAEHTRMPQVGFLQVMYIVASCSMAFSMF